MVSYCCSAATSLYILLTTRNGGFAECLFLCRPFQELSENLEGSLCRPQRTKCKKRPSCSGGLDIENTPNELIQQWSPPHKKLLTSAKGKENEENIFVLARRPRKRRESSGL